MVCVLVVLITSRLRRHISVHTWSLSTTSVLISLRGGIFSNENLKKVYDKFYDDIKCLLLLCFREGMFECECKNVTFKEWILQNYCIPPERKSDATRNNLDYATAFLTF